MAIVAPIQRAVDRPPQASSAGESRRRAWSAVSSRHSTTSARCTPAVHYTCAARTRTFQPPYFAWHIPTYTTAVTSPREADGLLGRPQQQELPASRRAACARCRTGSRAIDDETHPPAQRPRLQVTVPNVPSESGRATSDELLIIFKLVTFFKIYSTTGTPR